LKELAIVSGKGGTGKTTITASLIALAHRKIKLVIADCDVDASNLHLLLNPQVEVKEKFSGSKVAEIDLDKCVDCGVCEGSCRFDAIRRLKVDPLACEGCGVCVYICPVKAVKLKDRVSGYLYVSKTVYGPMCHADLLPGESNSGRLVALVRHHARKIASEKKIELIVSDGAPGVGCPVISTLTGVNYAAIVAEPTASGLHDFKRILGLIRHFRKIKPLALINVWDINPDVSKTLVDYCQSNGIKLLGLIPFDEKAVEAAVERKPLTEYAPKSSASNELKAVWENLSEQILEK
jgi:MinD superfamily P-loop ATPase